MGVFGTSAGRMGNWKYPFYRSSLEKNSGSVEATKITTGSPGTVRFRYHVERTGPRRRGTSNNPCFLHLEKLRLGGG